MVFAARVGDVGLNDDFREERSLSFGSEIIAHMKNQPIGTSFEGNGKNDPPVGVRRVAPDTCPFTCAAVVAERLFFKVDAHGSSGKSNARVEDVGADHEKLLGGRSGKIVWSSARCKDMVLRLALLSAALRFRALFSTFGPARKSFLGA